MYVNPLECVEPYSSSQCCLIGQSVVQELCYISTVGLSIKPELIGISWSTECFAYIYSDNRVMVKGIWLM